MSQPQADLSAMYVLTFNECPDRRAVDKQGKIVGAVGCDHYYLVQWFSWITGHPMDMRIIHIEDMLEWSLFDDEDQWRDQAREEAKLNRAHAWQCGDRVVKTVRDGASDEQDSE